MKPERDQNPLRQRIPRTMRLRPGVWGALTWRRGAGRDPVCFQDGVPSRLQSCGSLCIVGRARTTAAPLGLAWLSVRPGRLQLHPPLLQAAEPRRSSGARTTQGRETGTGLGLRSVSSRPDDMPLEVRFGSVSGSCCGFSSSFFKGEGPRLQEGRKGGRKCAVHDGSCSFVAISDFRGVG